MTVLADLSKSVSEMSDDDLLARVRSLRISRGATPAPKPKSGKERSPAFNAAAFDPSKLDPAAAEGLLALLEGLIDD